MKWKRIKCFLTGGHRLYDKNLQTIHDTNGYHFINYCVKCGKVFAAFMAEAELNGQKQLRPLVLRSSTLPATATALYRSTLKRHWCMSCCT